MIPLFLIDALPDNATYADNSTFVEMSGQDCQHHAQIVDIAWSEAKLEQIKASEIRGKWAQIFDVKDAQMTPADREILCSICIFKREVEVNHRPFQFYINALKEKIERFAQPDYKRQKLRVYVGDNLWDTLHREGILKNNEVDFVRMVDSSRFSIMGMQWRVLAYDDYNYQCVYMNDTHRVPDELPDDNFEKQFPMECWDQFHFSFDSVLPWQDRFLNLYSMREFKTEHWFNSHYFFTYELNDYFNFNDLRILRGSRRLPFSDIVSIIDAAYRERRKLYQVYDPRFNIWTEFGHLPFWLEWVNMLAFWVYFLRKHLTLRYFYLKEYDELLENLDENHFLKRLHRQIFEDEGNSIFVY